MKKFFIHRVEEGGLLYNGLNYNFGKFGKQNSLIITLMLPFPKAQKIKFGVIFYFQKWKI